MGVGTPLLIDSDTRTLDVLFSVVAFGRFLLVRLYEL